MLGQIAALEKIDGAGGDFRILCRRGGRGRNGAKGKSQSNEDGASKRWSFHRGTFVVSRGAKCRKPELARGVIGRSSTKREVQINHWRRLNFSMTSKLDW